MRCLSEEVKKGTGLKIALIMVSTLFVISLFANLYFYTRQYGITPDSGLENQIANLQNQISNLQNEIENLKSCMHACLVGAPAWIMVERIAYTSHTRIIQITEQDLTKYPKLNEAIQEAEAARLKHLAHPTEMIKLTNSEGKALVEFLSGKQVNAPEVMEHGFVIRYDENLYFVSIIFSSYPPVIS